MNIPLLSGGCFRRTFTESLSLNVTFLPLPLILTESDLLNLDDCPSSLLSNSMASGGTVGCERSLISTGFGLGQQLKEKVFLLGVFFSFSLFPLGILSSFCSSYPCKQQTLLFVPLRNWERVFNIKQIISPMYCREKSHNSVTCEVSESLKKCWKADVFRN